MPRPPAPVKGVYQREDDPSGNWYARFRLDGKLVKKSFGNNRAAAIEYVMKVPDPLCRSVYGHTRSPCQRGSQNSEGTGGYPSGLISPSR